MLTTPADARRMAHNAHLDGHDDRWHAPFARAHGADHREIFAALKAGRADGIADERQMLEAAYEKQPCVSAEKIHGAKP